MRAHQLRYFATRGSGAGERARLALSYLAHLGSPLTMGLFAVQERNETTTSTRKERSLPNKAAYSSSRIASISSSLSASAASAVSVELVVLVVFTVVPLEDSFEVELLSVSFFFGGAGFGFLNGGAEKQSA